MKRILVTAICVLLVGATEWLLAQTKPESLTKMALRLVQFLAIMLTPLALVPSGAHLGCTAE